MLTSVGAWLESCSVPVVVRIRLCYASESRLTSGQSRLARSSLGLKVHCERHHDGTVSSGNYKVMQSIAPAEESVSASEELAAKATQMIGVVADLMRLF